MMTKTPKKTKWTKAEFEKLSKGEQMLELAKLNIEMYGDIVAPPEVAFAMQVRTCPHCKIEKPVISSDRNDFGVKRDHDGVMRAQGWCRACRNSKSAHPARYGVTKNSVPGPLDLATVDEGTRAQIMALLEKAKKKS